MNTVTLRPWLRHRRAGPGYPYDGRYAELFWLPVVGPSAIWTLRRFGDALSANGFNPTDVDLGHVANSIGLSLRRGATSPFMRAVDRLHRFGLIVAEFERGAYLVRPLLPAVPLRLLERCAPSVQDAHSEWVHTHHPERTTTHG